MPSQSTGELALAILPHLADSVLKRRVKTYGHYAGRIGLNPAKDAIPVGHAMHTIGAACVFKCVPVVPLHFVQRADEGWRGVFESDPLEARDVLPHYNTLYIAAREYPYSEDDFQSIGNSLHKMAEIGSLDSYSLSPHHLWHLAIVTKPKDSAETYFERALRAYTKFIDEEREKRKR